MRALARFAEDWLPETADDRGAASDRFPIPGPLAQYFHLTRQRPGLLGKHNGLSWPEQWWQGPDGLVGFGAENQGCFHWLFDPAQVADDPLSAFLLRFAVFEIAVAATYHAGTWPRHGLLTEDQAALLTAGMTPLPCPPWTLRGTTTRVLTAPGLIASVFTLGTDAFGVSYAAVHRSLLRALGTTAERRAPRFSRRPMYRIDLVLTGPEGWPT